MIETRALQDARGCLTPAGVAVLREAAPGRAPAGLAAHVAGCARCQDRLLAADPGLSDRRARRSPPPRWRVFALLALGLLIAVVVFAWASRLLSG